MSQIVGIRFKEAGKVYYFDPVQFSISKGDLVIVETAHGVECGECTIANSEVREDEIVKPLKQVVRPATADDKRRYNEKLKKQENAFNVCCDKIARHGLDMKLVEVEYAFDGSKIIFYFTSDGRVDFRELVKDLASVFRTRIELRQIGVRDEAKMLGGLGICGREFCCAGFLNDFQPVSIKMAKEQGLSLNPVKISGTCGRLMCCLKYEQDAYEYLAKMTPRIGSYVAAEDGTQGVVIEVNLISGNVKVRPDSAGDNTPVMFKREQLTVLRQRGQRGENNGENGAEAAGQRTDNARTVNTPVRQERRVNPDEPSGHQDRPASPESGQDRQTRGDNKPRGDRRRRPSDHPRNSSSGQNFNSRDEQGGASEKEASVTAPAENKEPNSSGNA